MGWAECNLLVTKYVSIVVLCLYVCFNANSPQHKLLYIGTSKKEKEKFYLFIFVSFPFLRLFLDHDYH